MPDELVTTWRVDDQGSVVLEQIGINLKRVNEEAARVNREAKRSGEDAAEAFETLQGEVQESARSLQDLSREYTRAAIAAQDADEAGRLFAKAGQIDKKIEELGVANRRIAELAQNTQAAARFRVIDDEAVESLREFSDGLNVVNQTLKEQRTLGDDTPFAFLRDTAAELVNIREGIEETIQSINAQEQATVNLSRTEQAAIARRRSALEQVLEDTKKREQEIGDVISSRINERLGATAKAVEAEKALIQSSRLQRSRLDDQIALFQRLGEEGKLAADKIVLGERNIQLARERTFEETPEQAAIIQRAKDRVEFLRQEQAELRKLQRLRAGGTGFDPFADLGELARRRIPDPVKIPVQLETPDEFLVDPDFVTRVGDSFAAVNEATFKLSKEGTQVLGELQNEFNSLFDGEPEIVRAAGRIQNNITNAIGRLIDRQEELDRAVLKSGKDVEILTDKQEILANGGRIVQERLAGISDEVFKANRAARDSLEEEIAALLDLEQEFNRAAAEAIRFAEAQDRAAQIEVFSDEIRGQAEQVDQRVKDITMSLLELANRAEATGEVEVGEFSRIRSAIRSVIADSQERLGVIEQVATKTRGITDEEVAGLNDLGQAFVQTGERAQTLIPALEAITGVAERAGQEIAESIRVEGLSEFAQKSAEDFRQAFTRVEEDVQDLRDALKTGRDVEEGAIQQVLNQLRALPFAADASTTDIGQLKAELASLGQETRPIDDLIREINQMALSVGETEMEVLELAQALRLAGAERTVGQELSQAFGGIDDSLRGAKASVAEIRREFKAVGDISDESLARATQRVIALDTAVDQAEQEVLRLGQQFDGASGKIDQALIDATSRVEKLRDEQAKVRFEFSQTEQAITNLRTATPVLEGLRVSQSEIARDTQKNSKLVEILGRRYKTAGLLGKAAARAALKENLALQASIRNQRSALVALAEQVKGTPLEAEVKRAVSAVDQLEKETRQAEAAIRDTGLAANFLEESIDGAREAMEVFFAVASGGLSSIISIGGRIVSWLNPLNLVRSAVGTIGGAISAAFGGGGGGGGPIGFFIRNLRSAAGAVVGLGATVASTIGGGVLNIFRTLFNSVFSLRGLLGSLFVGIGVKEAIEGFNSFRQQINGVQAASAAGVEAIRRLEDANFALAQRTRFTTQDVADAQRFLAQEGLNPQQIEQVAKSTADFAEAASLNLAKASDIALKTTNQFRLGLGELETVQDVLIATTNNSAATIEGLAQTLKNVGPVAASFGISLEETAAATAVLARAGIRGGEAGTVLRTSLARIQKPGGAAVEVLEKLGRRIGKDFRKELFDTNGTIKGLANTFQFLEEAGAAPRDLVAIFGQEAQRAGSALLGNSRNVRIFGERLEEVSGITEEAARIQKQGLNQATLELTSSFDVLVKTVVRALEPSLVKLFNSITSGLRVIRTRFIAFAQTPLFAEILTSIRDFGNAAIGFLSGFFFPTIVKGFQKLVRDVIPALSDLASRAIDGVGDVVNQLLEKVGIQGADEFFGNIAERVRGFGETLRTGVIPNIEELLRSFRLDAGAVRFFNSIELSIRNIGLNLLVASRQVLEFVDSGIRNFARLAVSVSESTSEAFSAGNVFTFFVESGKKAVDIVISAFDVLVPAVKVVFGKVAQSIAGLLQQILNTVGRLVGDVKVKLSAFIPKATFDQLNQLDRDLVDLGKSLFPDEERRRLEAATRDLLVALEPLRMETEGFGQALQTVSDTTKIAAETGLPSVTNALEGVRKAEADYRSDLDATTERLNANAEAAKKAAEARGTLSTAPIQTTDPNLPTDIALGPTDTVIQGPDPDPGFRTSFLDALGQAGDQRINAMISETEQVKALRQEQLETIKEFTTLESQVLRDQAIADAAFKAQQNATTTEEQVKAGKQIVDAQKKLGETQGKFDAARRKATIIGTKQLFGALLQANVSGSSKIFQATKAFAIGDAVIQAFRGANRALGSLPFPANIVTAAAILAQGFANVKRIKGTQPGGGGGGGGGGPSIPNVPPPSIPEPSLPEVTDEEGEAIRGRRDLQVIIEGNVFGDEEFVRDRIAPVLRDAIEDNENFGLDVSVSRA